MREDKFRYTKFGLTNALWSLIPIFPTWTLIPGIMLASVIGFTSNNCELGYTITLWMCILLTVFMLIRHFKNPEVDKDKTTERQLKMNFRIFSLGIYTLLNTIILILIVGTNLACYGDGQTILACIISGPISSIGLILLGLTIDMIRRTTSPNTV